VKIGIAIPAYNVLPYIENALTTIGAQIYPCLSYIVDDASTDGTYEFLMERPAWYHMLFRNPARLGWPTSLNLAAQMAFDDGCDAIFTMNADDFLRLDCISRALALITDQHKDWAVVYAQQIGDRNVVQISSENATLEDFREYPPLVNYALIPKHVWQAVGGYPTDVTLPGSYGYKEDYAFWIEVFKAGFTNYGVVKEPVYYYLMHPGQLHEAGESRYEEAHKLVMDKHWSNRL
jgi:GT2 family glycosyltransferase